jgi:heme-degrading monooxygenase HmoA
MYARFVWGKLQPGMWEEYERDYDKIVVPKSQQIKGSRGQRLLRGVEDPNEGISISLWETKENMENYAKSPEQKDRAKEAEKLYTADYWVKHFGIKVSTV